jgi:hypothetical protein
VSTEEQALSGVSLDAQHERTQAYCSVANLSLIHVGTEPASALHLVDMGGQSSEYGFCHGPLLLECFRPHCGRGLRAGEFQRCRRKEMARSLQRTRGGEDLWNDAGLTAINRA